MRRPTPNKLLSLGAIIICYFPLLTNSYRIGDAVGILLRTHTPSSGSSTLEAYRHQLPRFGVSTKTRFDVSSLLNADDLRLSEEDSGPRRPKPQGRTKTSNEHLRLSLSFDEGFHHIPWVDVSNPSRQKFLDTLTISIVYSASDGAIHAVHRETKYQENFQIPKGGDSMPKSFTVEYIWVNEADVDIQGGLLALLLTVLIVSLSLMLGSCISPASEDGRGKIYKEKQSSSFEVAVSSEGFAKSL